MNEIKDENKFLVGVIVVGIVCLFAWVLHDIGRNKPTYNNTDATVERIEGRISGIEQRIDTMSKRFDQAEKTISDLGGRIESSTSLAGEIATGIDGTESRLANAIQRSGRIANILADIETANRKGKKNP